MSTKLSAGDLKEVASNIGIVIGNDRINRDRVVDKVLNLEENRSSPFLDSCHMCKASDKGKEVVDIVVDTSNDRCCFATNKNGPDKIEHQVVDGRTTSHGEWSVVKGRKNKKNVRK